MRSKKTKRCHNINATLSNHQPSNSSPNPPSALICGLQNFHFQNSLTHTESLPSVDNATSEKVSMQHAISTQGASSYSPSPDCTSFLQSRVAWRKRCLHNIAQDGDRQMQNVTRNVRQCTVSHGSQGPFVDENAARQSATTYYATDNLHSSLEKNVPAQGVPKTDGVPQMITDVVLPIGPQISPTQPRLAATSDPINACAAQTFQQPLIHHGALLQSKIECRKRCSANLTQNEAQHGEDVIRNVRRRVANQDFFVQYGVQNDIAGCTNEGFSARAFNVLCNQDQQQATTTAHSSQRHRRCRSAANQSKVSSSMSQHAAHMTPPSMSNEGNQITHSTCDAVPPPEHCDRGSQTTSTQQNKRRAHTKSRGGSRNVRRRVYSGNLESDYGDGSGTSGSSATLHTNEGISPSYEDLGDCNERCRHCGAAFWYGERVQRDSRNNRPEYHLCCGGGRIIMDPERDPPQYIKDLLSNAAFMENIRAYNQMFAMTSFGANIDKSVNAGPGPYVFKVSGQIYHYIGSLCPLGNDTPCFLQLYIYDTQKEVENRLSHFSPSEQNTLDPQIVEGLIHFLDTHNELVKVLRTARDLCAQADIPEFKLKLYNGEGARGYELPTSNTLAAIVFDSGPTTESDYDVIIQYKGEQPQRINKLHKSYMSLQFPLIFIYGQSGYHTKLTLRSADPTEKPKRVSMNTFYTYQLHPRPDSYDLLFRTGRLFQQYVVGVYCCIEQNRMDFYRTHQSDIRGEYLSGLYDAVSRGDFDGSEAGSRIILPSSFTGGPRYMYSHYLDALAICRKLGNPQYFITFTSNVKWPEIRTYMAEYPHLTTTDRADVVCRVFEQKIEAFIKFLKNKQPFGHVTGVLYTVEFQKRGLPHCHTLVWIHSNSRIETAQDVDKYISAELPDPAVDPQGYKVVSVMMMHGPCGSANPNAPCMEGKDCTKNFPKTYNAETFFDSNGRVHYRRRQTKAYTMKRQMKLDNTYVMPYNRTLLLAFHAHINVEYCGSSMLIKYLFKYISKGTDRVFEKITRSIGQPSTSTNPPQQVDEIQNFLDGRFICPHEVCWRILKFIIHSREPAVQILSVHLENMQHVTFRDNDDLESVVNRRDRKVTTLTEWFAYNSEYEDGRHLTYLEFPSEYVWYNDRKCWQRRQRNQSSIGRLAYIHPSLGEVFYFRMLLCHQKGCRGFTEVRKVNQVLYPTYRAACEALGLLGDDREWDKALEEACCSASS